MAKDDDKKKDLREPSVDLGLPGTTREVAQEIELDPSEGERTEAYSSPAAALSEPDSEPVLAPAPGHEEEVPAKVAVAEPESLGDEPGAGAPSSAIAAPAPSADAIELEAASEPREQEAVAAEAIAREPREEEAVVAVYEAGSSEEVVREAPEPDVAVAVYEQEEPEPVEVEPEPIVEEEIDGLAAYFDYPADLLRASAAARDEGYSSWDAYSPFPIHGIEDAMGTGRSWLPWVTFAAGATGFMLANMLQFGTLTFDWPMIVGGKPYAPWPSFVPIMFELTVLIGGVTTALVMFIASGCLRKPKIIDPEITNDRFVLWIASDDPEFASARDFMARLNPVDIRPVTFR